MLHQKIDPSTNVDRNLCAENVSISIGKTPIVRDVSFEAASGELLAIIGPSGSGKTTLLRALTGELSYEGHAFLSGRELGGMSAEDQAVLRGVLPQISQISFPLTVSEVVALGLLDRRAGRLQRETRISEALAKVGLAGFEGRTYQDLSGGEQQRTQLARVLCQVWDPVPADGQPRWLFLDEPVSSLDIKHQYQIMHLAADYAARGGGVVAVMHDLNLTAEFANKVLVMKCGKQLAYGSNESVMCSGTLTTAYDFQLDLVEDRSGRKLFLHPAPVKI
ncbi:heme ABC transporter ATP-binding protein [Roseibium sp.]|uniref:heme ABC transporter ATP-binding protein n=1 Tax=Roseibium sp. TaxID=1936156 RepID=UPI0039F0C63D